MTEKKPGKRGRKAGLVGKAAAGDFDAAARLLDIGWRCENMQTEIARENAYAEFYARADMRRYATCISRLDELQPKLIQARRLGHKTRAAGIERIVGQIFSQVQAAIGGNRYRTLTIYKPRHAMPREAVLGLKGLIRRIDQVKRPLERIARARQGVDRESGLADEGSRPAPLLSDHALASARAPDVLTALLLEMKHRLVPFFGPTASAGEVYLHCPEVGRWMLEQKPPIISLAAFDTFSTGRRADPVLHVRKYIIEQVTAQSGETAETVEQCWAEVRRHIKEISRTGFIISN
jgi:hypothetical protein